MISLRPATREDMPSMFHILEAAMRLYVERTWGPWDTAWQWKYFQEHFACDRCRIVVVDSQDAGYFQVVRQPDHFFIEFIILHPMFHRRGVGSDLIRGLLAEAGREKLPVGLQVLKVNPARRLYERLGFVQIGETDSHIQMEARPHESRPEFASHAETDSPQNTGGMRP